MAPYCPPVGSNYSQVSLSADEAQHIFRIMGKGGKWFKNFTHKQKLKYVWFNKERSVIELWGRHDYIENSIPIVKSRVANIMLKVSQPFEGDEEVIDVDDFASCSSLGDVMEV